METAFPARYFQRRTNEVATPGRRRRRLVVVARMRPRHRQPTRTSTENAPASGPVRGAHDEATAAVHAQATATANATATTTATTEATTTAPTTDGDAAGTNTSSAIPTGGKARVRRRQPLPFRGPRLQLTLLRLIRRFHVREKILKSLASYREGSPSFGHHRIPVTVRRSPSPIDF